MHLKNQWSKLLEICIINLFCNTIIWDDEANLNCDSTEGKNKKFAWTRKNKTFKQQLITPTDNYGDDYIMILGRFNDIDVKK